MALTIILEILLIAVLVGGSYYGIATGFFKLATKPLKLIAALLFAYALCGVVGKFVIAPIIQSPITNYVKDFMYEHCDSLEPGEVVEEIPTLLKMAGAAFNVTAKKQSIMDKLEEKKEAAKAMVGEMKPSLRTAEASL